MILDRQLRSKITPDSDANAIRLEAVKLGMTKMRISGARKVAMGWTTMDEVLRAVPMDEELQD